MNLELIAIALLLALNLVLLLWLLLRKPPLDAATLASAVGAGVDKAERNLRQEIAESARAGRQESTQALAGFQQALLAQGAEPPAPRTPRSTPLPSSSPACRVHWCSRAWRAHAPRPSGSIPSRSR